MQNTTKQDIGSSFDEQRPTISDTTQGEIVDVTPTYSRSESTPSMNASEQPQQQVSSKSRNSRLTFGKLISILIFFVAVILIGVFVFGYTMISNSGSYVGKDSQGQDIFSQIGQLGSILNITKRSELKGEKEGRTNVLLLGRDESGSDLTDTIMIASYYHREKKIVTLNIPRDLYVYNETKINALYTLGEQEKEGFGEQKLIKFITDEYQIPIHYYTTINFNGVKDIVDTLGGVDVDVPNEFTDFEYPNDGYAYIKGSPYMRPAPEFKQGVQNMDGKRALIYARSRHAGGVEGGDFSRSKRQSIVVQAILQKIKSQNILDNASKISAYLGIIQKNFKTNMRLDELSAFAQILKDVDLQSNFLRANWDTANGFLCFGMSDIGASIIQYCDGTAVGFKIEGKSHSQAVDYVQNLLLKVESSDLFEKKVVLLGNGSFDTDSMYSQFLKWGFNDVVNNNAYTIIKPATASSVESVNVYIQNDDIKSKFESLANDTKITYTVSNQIPNTVKIPTNSQKADIIVWVAPKLN